MEQGRKRRLFRYSVDAFLDVLGQVTGRKDIPYRCSQADKRAWETFVERFGDGIGETFIDEFVRFGAQSWFNSRTEKDYSRTVRYGWIFGKSGIGRWERFSGETRRRMVRKELNGKLSGAAYGGCLTKLLNTVRPVEESFKAEYHNTSRGLMWCVANTSLYFHKSRHCLSCDYKRNCMDILEREYPKLYKSRGYGRQ